MSDQQTELLNFFQELNQGMLSDPQETVSGGAAQVLGAIMKHLAPAATEAYDDIQGIEFAVPGTDYTNQDLYGAIGEGKEQVRNWAEKIKAEEFASEDRDYNWFKDFMAETGADLAEFIPESNLGVAAEGLEELVPMMKLMAFLPPAVYRPLLKEISGDVVSKGFKRVAMDQARKSPVLQDALNRYGFRWLHDVVKLTKDVPETSWHGGAKHIAPDEIDLNFARSGAGADMQGQGLYSNTGDRSKYDYTFAAIQKAIQEGKIDWKLYTEPAKKELIAELGDEFIYRNPSFDNSVLPGDMDARYRKYLDQQEEITQRAVKRAVEDPDVPGAISEFTSAPGTAEISYDEPLPKGLDRAVRDNVIEIIDELEPIIGKRQAAHIRNRMTNTRSRESIGNLAAALELPSVNDPGKVYVGPDLAYTILNRALRDAGIDQLSVPTGRFTPGYEGHKNLITNQPAVFNDPTEVVLRGPDVSQRDVEDAITGLEARDKAKGAWSSDENVAQLQKLGDEVEEQLNILKESSDEVSDSARAIYNSKVAGLQMLINDIRERPVEVLFELSSRHESNPFHGFGGEELSEAFHGRVGELAAKIQKDFQLESQLNESIRTSAKHAAWGTPEDPSLLTGAGKPKVVSPDPPNPPSRQARNSIIDIGKAGVMENAEELLGNKAAALDWLKENPTRYVEVLELNMRYGETDPNRLMDGVEIFENAIDAGLSDGAARNLVLRAWSLGKR